MSDESIINLSDSTKATMRNYAMVAGFMTLFIHSAIAMAGTLNIGSSTMPDSVMYYSVIAISLVIFGSILAFLHKRDQVSITFLMIGVVLLLNVTGTVLFNHSAYGFFIVYAAIALILGITMLFTRNEQRYICATILIIPEMLILIGSIAFDSGCIDLSTDKTLISAGAAIRALASIYAVLCIGLENPRFPGYRFLTADENDEAKDGSPVHFKVSGSVLGYMMFMIPILATIFYKLNLFNLGQSDIIVCSCVCGLVMIFIGFLMLVAGRMKFTPFLFMILGILLALLPVVQIPWLFGIFFMVMGIICLFRTDRRILVGAAIVIFGICMLFVNNGHAENITAFLILSIALFAMFTYICFALCSDNRLKLI